MASLSLLGELQVAPHLMSAQRDSGMLSHRVTSNFANDFTSRASSVAGVTMEVARDVQVAVNTAEFSDGDAARLADAIEAARSSRASSMSALARAPVRRCNQYADNLELLLTSASGGAQSATRRIIGRLRTTRGRPCAVALAFCFLVNGRGHTCLN